MTSHELAQIDMTVFECSDNSSNVNLLSLQDLTSTQLADARSKFEYYDRVSSCTVLAGIQSVRHKLA